MTQELSYLVSDVHKQRSQAVEGTRHKKTEAIGKQKPKTKKGVESSLVERESVNNEVGVIGSRKKKKKGTGSRDRKFLLLCNRVELQILGAEGTARKLNSKN